MNGIDLREVNHQGSVTVAYRPPYVVHKWRRLLLRVKHARYSALWRRGGFPHQDGTSPPASSPPDVIAAELQRRFGLRIEPITVDVEGYHRFLREGRFEELGQRKVSFVQKTLEYYAPLSLLGITADTILVDVASATSYYPHVIRQMYGCRVYRQDLIYSRGVHADSIGGDATDMPLADDCVDIITMHNSLDNFEGRADERLLPECERVLVPGGLLCIVPLFVDEVTVNRCDPFRTGPNAPWDETAVRVWEPDSGYDFGRSYGYDDFEHRILANMGGLELIVYHVTNCAEVDPKVNVHFIAIFRKPRGRPE
jgi:SAM-dependent methyltransferase